MAKAVNINTGTVVDTYTPLLGQPGLPPDWFMALTETNRIVETGNGVWSFSETPDSPLLPVAGGSTFVHDEDDSVRVWDNDLFHANFQPEEVYLRNQQAAKEAELGDSEEHIDSQAQAATEGVEETFESAESGEGAETE